MNDERIRQLVNSYHPNSQVLQAVTKFKLVATVGPSASGKTTIMQALNRRVAEIKLVLGETTRHPRFGERPGIDYLFRTKDEVIQDIQDGVLVDVIVGPNGDLYCTRASSFPEHGVSVMALVPEAVKKFRNLGLKYFKVAFVVPYNYNGWRKWLSKQAEAGRWTKQQMKGRLEESKTSYAFALSDQETSFILNDDVVEAARRLWQVAQGKTPDDEVQARKTAEANYQQLMEDTEVK